MKYIKGLQLAFLIIIILIIFKAMCHATQVTVPVTWKTGDTVTDAKLNSVNNAFATVINGGLDNTNTASGYKMIFNVSSLPVAGTQGNIDFLTSDNSLNIDNGAAWLKTITTSTPATGNIPYYNSGWQLLTPGTQYYPLVSNGTTSLPSYQALPPTGITGGAVTQGTVFFASTSTVTAGLPPATSGQFLQTQGVGVNPQWATATFVPHNIQVFTSSGTWTKPTGISNVYVKVIGKGGTGNSSNGTNGGGGGGGYSEGMTAVTANVTVTIGSTNSFAGSVTISATSGSNSSGSAGGAGGTGSGGSINLSGQNGQTGSNTGVSGAGGNTAMGFGGLSVISGAAVGNNGTSYGGGGSGDTNTQGAGTGDAGAVIVYY